jgi:hypothetical protein
MPATTPRRPLSPDEQRAIRRHLHSAEGAHLMCRRKACRRARCCRLVDTCASPLAAAGGPGLVDSDLMALGLAYRLALFDHWARLPRRPARRTRLRRRDASVSARAAPRTG